MLKSLLVLLLVELPSTIAAALMSAQLIGLLLYLLYHCPMVTVGVAKHRRHSQNSADVCIDSHFDHLSLTQSAHVVLSLCTFAVCKGVCPCTISVTK